MTKKNQDGRKTLDGQNQEVASGGLHLPNMKLTSASEVVSTVKATLESLLQQVGDDPVTKVTEMLEDVGQLIKALKIRYGDDTLVNVMDKILDEAHDEYEDSDSSGDETAHYRGY